VGVGGKVVAAAGTLAGQVVEALKDVREVAVWSPTDQHGVTSFLEFM
jgi:hypothetical protein